MACGQTVVIVGGSIGGLLLALSYRKSDRITILEKSHADWKRYSAGLSLGPWARILLGRWVPNFDSMLEDQAIPNTEHTLIWTHDSHTESRTLKVDKANSVWTTNWSAIHEILLKRVEQKRVEIQHGSMVTDAHFDNNKWKITYTSADGSQGIKTADVLIAADGAFSTVRSLLLQDQKPTYSGYVAWRGRWPADETIPTVVDRVLKGNLVWIMMSGHYIILYAVPYENSKKVGSGNLCVEYCWYYRYEESFLDANIMKDIHGRIHRSTVTPDLLRPPVWNHQLEMTRKEVSPEIWEVISRCKAPSATKVISLIGRQAFSHDGKLYYIGDALGPILPHLGANFDVVAMQARTFREMMRNRRMKLKKWNKWVLEYKKKRAENSKTVGNLGMTALDKARAHDDSTTYINNLVDLVESLQRADALPF